MDALAVDCWSGGVTGAIGGRRDGGQLGDG